MQFISLTHGYQALVDDEDYEYLSKFKWHYDKGYAVRNAYLGGGRKNPKRRYTAMHAVINKTPKGYDTDHINRNRLDNRRANLRTVTHQENLYNNPLRPNNKSGHAGITWHKPNSQWRVKVGNRHIGLYKSLDYAIKARQFALEREGFLPFVPKQPDAQ